LARTGIEDRLMATQSKFEIGARVSFTFAGPFGSKHVGCGHVVELLADGRYRIQLKGGTRTMVAEKDLALA
jgi:hypothetical protein